jgi:plasmid stabilization system protein ParE
MMTSFSVLIAPEAAADVSRINQYLLENWSERVRDNFIKKLRKSVALIQVMPLSYPVSSTKATLRKCVITPQTSLYYTIKDETIVIVSVLDNRMNHE